MSKLSPLMRQYYEIKNKYPDTILLFQVGDFYEIFFDDAKKAASFLGITLTQRGTDINGNHIPLAGVPVHVLDHYITKLIKGGFKVAVCDQLSEARPGKVVQRGITQVLTPGTLTDMKLLDEKSASYLCAIFPHEESCSIIFAEILTGQIFTTLINSKSLKFIEAELSRFLPDEIIVPDNNLSNIYEKHFRGLGYVVSRQQVNLDFKDLDDWMNKKFTQSIVSFINNSESLKSVVCVLYSYLKHNNPESINYFKQFYIYNIEDFLILDSATSRNLELVKNAQDGGAANTLFSILDKAATSMGSRTIKKWLLRPLVNQELIFERFDVIDCFINNLDLKQDLFKTLKGIGDLERIIGRIALKRAQLYDYINLKRTLFLAPIVNQLLCKYNNIKLIEKILTQFTDFTELCQLLDRSLNEDRDIDWLISKGYSEELDRLRLLVDHGSQEILKLESQEQANTGINSLKIRYNQVHGYVIEVTKPNVKFVPEKFIRIQTLSHKERYTTQELKDLEYDILRARNEIVELEKNIFESIKEQVLSYLNSLKRLSQAICHIDALLGLTEVAYSNNYVRPRFNLDQNIIIDSGRHPVIESKIGSNYIPNDTKLNKEQSLWILTGPNMGGKSTYLRQVALISIMAQMGSFVPANSANLAILDRVFTRIGASDNVAEGKSTFLVEMEETALICNTATSKSLVILDEVGRGTSTFDGLAIAQAVVEHIYNNTKSRCLFATHYHELTELEKNSSEFPGIVSYYAASEKTKDGIVLLHKIKQGIASDSFGLEVAKIADLPKEVIARSQEILYKLKAQQEVGLRNFKSQNISTDNFSSHDLVLLKQDLLRAQDKIKDLEVQVSSNINNSSTSIISAKLSEIDCDNITPREALDILVLLRDASLKKESCVNK